MDTEALIYATQKLYEIEFSNKLVDIENPFNLTPITLDKKVDKWIRDIFSNVIFTKIPWTNVGVSSNNIGYTYKFKFAKEQCELLDCFPIINGTECEFNGPRNIPIQFNFNKIIACRPSCFQLLASKHQDSILLRESDTTQVAEGNNVKSYKPNSEYVYYDQQRYKCRSGLQQLRFYCFYPKYRQGYVDKDNYSFYWNEQHQNCEITEDYCTRYKGESFANGDCYLPTGQSILEFMFGKVIVRSLKFSGHHKLNTSYTKENNKEFIPNKHLDTSWIYVPKSTSNIYKYTHVLNKIGESLALMGQCFGSYAVSKFGPKVLLALSEMIESSTRLLIEHVVVNSVFHVGVEKVTSFLIFKTATVCAAQAAIRGLEAAASLLNPATYIIDIISIAGFVMDMFDTKYKNVFTKEQMKKAREAFIQKYNNSHKIVSDALFLYEITPELIYSRLFGHSIHRSSDAHTKTFYYFVDQFKQLTNKDNSHQYKIENEIFESIYFENYLSIFKRNMLSPHFFNPISITYSPSIISTTGIAITIAITTLLTVLGTFLVSSRNKLHNKFLTLYLFPVMFFILLVFFYKIYCGKNDKPTLKY